MPPMLTSPQPPAPSPKQHALKMVTLEELVATDHQLRKIAQYEFIREATAHLYYTDNGRPALDPVVLFKILFIGYLFGVRSERQLMREIQVNVTYRWFLDLSLTDKVPDASTLSQNRHRRFAGTDIEQVIFDREQASFDPTISRSKIAHFLLIFISADLPCRVTFFKHVLRGGLLQRFVTGSGAQQASDKHHDKDDDQQPENRHEDYAAPHMAPSLPLRHVCPHRFFLLARIRPCASGGNPAGWLTKHRLLRHASLSNTRLALVHADVGRNVGYIVGGYARHGRHVTELPVMGARAIFCSELKCHITVM